jgi:DNA-binding transcriptional MerR regulator
MTSALPFVESKQSLTIAEVSERTGLSHDTLRYYEKAGLIRRVDRTTGNHRCYAPADLDWIAFLLRLRETGMSIADMQRFAQLRSAGSASVPDRLTMLREHRDSLASRIHNLRQNQKAMDDKIRHYEQLLRDREPAR